MDDSTQGENWWKRLSGGLKRTSSSLGSSITALVSHRQLEPETLDALEDELVRADFGQDIAIRIVDALGQGRYPQASRPTR
jgi:fused signal recognition particle receptor